MAVTYNCQQNAACQRQLVSKARGKRDTLKYPTSGSKVAGRRQLEFNCHRPATWSPFTTAAGRRLSDLAATALHPPDNLTVAGQFSVDIIYHTLWS